MNIFSSRSCVSGSIIAGHSAGYFVPCHSRGPAIRAEVIVPTHVDGYHCFAATGLIPRTVQSRMIDRTDSPCSSSQMAASRIASLRADLFPPARCAA